MEIDKIIKDRFSVRKFSSKEIEQEKESKAKKPAKGEITNLLTFRKNQAYA